jgi:hypothetical protein
MECPLTPVFGNAESFGFNLELSCYLEIKHLEFSLSGFELLHLSDVSLLLEGKWVDIKTLQSVHATQSSVESFGAFIYSADNWLRQLNSNFSTEYQEDAQVKFAFSTAILVQGISVGNRIDGLWDRAKTLKVTAQTQDGKAILLWDGDNVAYPIARLTREIHNLHMQSFEIKKYSNSNEYDRKIVFDRLFSVSSELIMAPFLQSNQYKMLEVLNDFFHLYLKALDEGKTSLISLDITTLIKISDFLSDEQSEEVVISTVVFLLSKGEDLIAWKFLRRKLSKKITVDLKRLEKFTKQVGLLYLGYPVILTAHRFQRPLNSYENLDLRELIRNTLSVLKDIPNTESMICYGTLLGAIRDDDFIPHDDDMDVLLILKENDPLLSNIVERLVRLFEDRGLIVGVSKLNDVGMLPVLQIQDYKYPIHLDIFFGIQGNAQILMPMRQVINEYVDEALMLPVKYLETGTFTGFPVPSNPEGFFEMRYGNSWRTPDPLFRLNE